jgi:hypothetical protein
MIGIEKKLYTQHLKLGGGEDVVRVDVKQVWEWGQSGSFLLLLSLPRGPHAVWLPVTLPLPPHSRMTPALLSPR